MTELVYTCIKAVGTRGAVARLRSVRMRGRPDIRYNEYVGVNLSQLGQRPVNIAPLALQHLDLVNTLRAVDRLGAAVRTCGQHFADLGCAPIVLRGQQTFALVKTQSPQGDSGLMGKFPQWQNYPTRSTARGAGAGVGSIHTAGGMCAIFVVHAAPT